LAQGDHVRRNVAAVDIQTGPEVGQEQAAGSTTDVEGRLAVALDELLEVGDLSPALVELGPPLRYESVVPGLRRVWQLGPPRDGIASPAIRTQLQPVF
jgi:hypothetical protein